VSKTNQPIELVADANSAGQPLVHHWSRVVGAGRAAEALRWDWQEALRVSHELCGFEYVRFHGLFHDDMFVYRAVAGRYEFNFQYIDAVFDRMLEIGVRPFVEFGFMPGDLARTTGTVFWWKGNGSPPNDYSHWSELITAVLNHWVTRYGADEIAEWYFEVWNEPNLAPFWEGTRSEYFRLYEVTALALKAVDARFRVGGPATSNFVPDARFAGETENFEEHDLVRTSHDLDGLEWKPVWLTEFFDFCEKAKLPINFVSCHPYPTDWALDEHGQGLRLTRGVDATLTDITLLGRMISESAFPHAEMHLTEWSSSSSSRDFTHDSLQAATYVLRTNIAVIGLTNSLAYWTFTDVFEEQGAGDQMLHGGFGMLTLQGIPKPTFHAYRILNELGTEVLLTRPGGIVTRDDRSIQAAFFNYPDTETATVAASFDSRAIADRVAAMVSPRELKIAVSGLLPGSEYVLEIIDQDHGTVVESWKSIGSPADLTREQVAKLRHLTHHGRRTFHVVGADGTLQILRTLSAWSIGSLSPLASRATRSTA
jgi:xylan 1,4-beta-xylosidase